MKLALCLIALAAVTTGGCRPAAPATAAAATQPAPLLRDGAAVHFQGTFRDEGKNWPFVTVSAEKVYLTGPIYSLQGFIADGTPVAVVGVLRRHATSPPNLNEAVAILPPPDTSLGYWYVENATIRVLSSNPIAAATAYDPRTFRADVARLTAADHYRQAVALVAAADVDRQVAFDGRGYVAVAEDLILLPGVYPRVDYDRGRDWCLPGTSDAIIDGGWQAAATEFARRYNLRRAATTP